MTKTITEGDFVQRSNSMLSEYNKFGAEKVPKGLSEKISRSLQGQGFKVQTNASNPNLFEITTPSGNEWYRLKVKKYKLVVEKV